MGNLKEEFLGRPRKGNEYFNRDDSDTDEEAVEAPEVLEAREVQGAQEAQVEDVQVVQDDDVDEEEEEVDGQDQSVAVVTESSFDYTMFDNMTSDSDLSSDDFDVDEAILLGHHFYSGESDYSDEEPTEPLPRLGVTVEAVQENPPAEGQQPQPERRSEQQPENAEPSESVTSTE